MAALLLLSVTSKAQDQLIRVLKTGDAKKLDKFFKNRIWTEPKRERIPGRWILYRDIIPDSKYKRIYAKYPQDLTFYHLQAIVDDKRIIVWRIDRTAIELPDTTTLIAEITELSVEDMYLAQPTYNSVEEMPGLNGESFVDSASSGTLYSQFNTAFKNFYDVDFSTNLNFITLLEFGACGYEGGLANPFKTIGSIVSKADTATFDKWLRSGNVELQLYALDGYKQAGKTLDPALWKLVGYVLSLNAVIEECLGCTSELTTVKELARKNGFFDLLKK